jgi:hypothetical protein
VQVHALAAAVIHQSPSDRTTTYMTPTSASLAPSLRIADRFVELKHHGLPMRYPVRSAQSMHAQLTT